MKMLILILVIASTSTFAHNMPEDVKEKKVLSIINSKFNNLNFIDRMLERGLDQEKIEKVIIDKESLNISFTPSVNQRKKIVFTFHQNFCFTLVFLTHLLWIVLIFLEMRLMLTTEKFETK